MLQKSSLVAIAIAISASTSRDVEGLKLQRMDATAAGGNREEGRLEVLRQLALARQGGSAAATPPVAVGVDYSRLLPQEQRALDAARAHFGAAQHAPAAATSTAPLSISERPSQLDAARIPEERDEIAANGMEYRYALEEAIRRSLEGDADGVRVLAPQPAGIALDEYTISNYMSATNLSRDAAIAELKAQRHEYAVQQRNGFAPLSALIRSDELATATAAESSTAQRASRPTGALRNRSRRPDAARSADARPNERSLLRARSWDRRRNGSSRGLPLLRRQHSAPAL